MALLAVLQSLTFAASAAESEEAAPWVEVEPELPAMPGSEGLIDLYVTAVSTNRFAVAPGSVSVGSDGVVRYVVVVRSAAGATSTYFEGIRCKTHERRLYAFGRPDNTWSRAKTSSWTRISNAGANRYAYVLMREYFCPNGIAIGSTAEGAEALRRGGHPSARVSPTN